MVGAHSLYGTITIDYRGIAESHQKKAENCFCSLALHALRCWKERFTHLLIMLWRKNEKLSESSRLDLLCRKFSFKSCRVNMTKFLIEVHLLCILKFDAVCCWLFWDENSRGSNDTELEKVLLQSLFLIALTKVHGNPCGLKFSTFQSNVFAANFCLCIFVEYQIFPNLEK